MYLITEELEKHIKNNLLILNNYAGKEYAVEFSKIIFFEKAYDNSIPGSYIYSNSTGYHIDGVGDRGGIVSRFATENLEELYSKVFYSAASLISVNYAARNKIKGKDWRRVMFKYRLELLSLLGWEYYKKGKDEIDKILENAPYDDSLF